MAVNLVEDVTEIKRNEIAQRLLTITARELTQSHDPAAALQVIAEAAVPGMAIGPASTSSTHAGASTRSPSPIGTRTRFASAGVCAQPGRWKWTRRRVCRR